MDFLIPEGYLAYAVETLDLSDDAAHGPTSTNLKSSDDRPVKLAIISITDNTVHWTCHGTDATGAAGTDVGLVADAPSVIVLQDYENIKNFVACNEIAGSDAVVKIHYFN